MKPISRVSWYLSQMLITLAAIGLYVITLSDRYSKYDTTSITIFLFLFIGFFPALLGIRIWYLGWKSIQDGLARTTPRRAIVLLLIPIYNIYWVTQLTAGLIIDMKAWCKRYRFFSPNLSLGYTIFLMVYQLTLLLLLIFLPTQLFTSNHDDNSGLAWLFIIASVTSIVLLDSVIIAVNCAIDKKFT